MLKNGIYIDKFDLKKIHVEQLYIKWNENIDISAKKIDIEIDESKNNKSSNIDIQDYIKLIENNLNSLIINELNMKNLQLSFAYYKSKKGFINIKYKDIKLLSVLEHKNSELAFYIYEMILNKKHIRIDSKILLNNQELRYNLKFLDVIEDLSILDNFTKPQWLQEWVIDAIDMKNLEIKQISGSVNFEKPNKSFENLYILANINGLNYRYNKQLDSIHSTQTELELKNKTLFIRPKNAYSYGQFLDKSWVKLDFNKPDIIFTLRLLFDGVLNKDILKILKVYGVELPFLQHSGKVKTDLELNINLSNIDVNVKGDFYTQKANFDYLTLNFDIYNTHLNLDGLKIKIDKMIANYQDMATAFVKVNFNAKTKEGLINLKLSDINLLDGKLTLQQDNFLDASYIIKPSGSYIKAKKSSWIFKDITFRLPKLKLPFQNSIITIPKTKLLADNKLNSTIHGEVNVSVPTAKLNLHVEKLNYKNIQIEKPTSFEILYENNTTIIKHQKAVNLKIAGLQSYLQKLYISIKNGVLLLKDTNLKIDSYVDTNLNVTYNLPYGVGMVELKNLNISKQQTKLFEFPKSTYLFVQQNKNLINIYANKIRMKLTSDEEKWWIDFVKIDKLSQYSKYMKKYKVNDGSLHVEKLNSSDLINFKSTINYPYKLFIHNNKPIKKYIIKGSFNTKKSKLKLNLNNKIDVSFNESIDVDANNITLNMYETNRFYNEIVNDDKNSSSNITLILNAKNSSMFIDQNRKIVSNHIYLKYKNHITDAVMRYRKGKAFFKLKKNKFTFYGDNFDDDFMQHLFAFSKFKGGTFGFNVKGNLAEYQGAFYIKKTIIIKYKIINNILAFVNTVPSLLTFSLPNYDTEGMPVDLAYSIFKVKNRIFDVQKLSLDSPELKIVGDGHININNDTLNLKLQLKTDIGSDLKNVPLVGYIVLGNDTVSTNLHVYGDLKDPKVETFVVEDVLSAPLNILKRTITLPFYPFMEHK